MGDRTFRSNSKAITIRSCGLDKGVLATVPPQQKPAGDSVSPRGMSVSSELELTVDALGARRADGNASRYGFTLAWTATWDGAEWVVEVPPGHSLGPDGKGAFEVVTDDDLQRFVGAVRRVVTAPPRGSQP